MIAAVGRFEPAALRRALRQMAANENPAHHHEYRARGESHRHTDGWGMAWVEAGRLRTLRSTISVLLDGRAEHIDTLQTELLLLHARRATRPGSIRTRNTHPFPAALLGRDWAFCHNGSVEDLDGLRSVEGLAPAGGTDSERLFHHFLAELSARSEAASGSELPGPTDWAAPEAALAATIAVPRDFTALHCLVASTDRLLAATRRHPTRSRPEYHALWLGDGPGVRAVASEPVNGLNCSWTRLPEPGVITLPLAREQGDRS